MTLTFIYSIRCQLLLPYRTLAAIVSENPLFSLFYAPNFEKVGDILVSACPYVCMCVCVCVYSCSRYRLETSCMDSSWKNSRRIFLVFPELSPLVKLRPFDKQGDGIL